MPRREAASPRHPRVDPGVPRDGAPGRRSRPRGRARGRPPGEGARPAGPRAARTGPRHPVGPRNGESADPMGFLTTTLAFVVVLGIIIFVHEFGHLITAKAFGMRVFVFSFGFGKRLLGFKWGDTDCRVSAIPLGGYVKLEGEPGDHLSEDTARLGDGRELLSRPRWPGLLVSPAAPALN